MRLLALCVALAAAVGCEGVPLTVSAPDASDAINDASVDVAPSATPDAFFCAPDSGGSYHWDAIVVCMPTMRRDCPIGWGPYPDDTMNPPGWTCRCAQSCGPCPDAYHAAGPWLAGCEPD